MMTIKNILILVLMFFSITACSEELTYSYLMEHPLVLKKEVERCQALSNQYGKTSHCDVVIKAANDLYVILSDQQADPEKFGQQILDAEFACMQLRDQVNKAKQQFNNFKAKNSTPDVLQAAQEEVDNAQKRYEDGKERVKILLGVAGLNSPE